MARTGGRLVDAEGLARRFGVGVTTIQRWKRYGLIEVADMRGQTPLYDVAEARRRMREAVATGRKRSWVKGRATRTGRAIRRGLGGKLDNEERVEFPGPPKKLSDDCALSFLGEIPYGSHPKNEDHP